MEKERHPFYEKPIKTLNECKTGDYVYNGSGELCYVERTPDGYYNLYYNGFLMGTNGDHVVYPVTLATSDIMERIRAHRDKWHKAHMMNAHFSGELEERLYHFMQIDPYSEDYREQFNTFWEELEAYYGEMLEHAKALHIV